ncbi:hypothetical protein ACFFWC_02420 [Plantactinospora siamensis]|uniref:Uncharacterized protein n=1 Tax=Plantactinospora siamensis TaxID=555372 RepID=A0ABV6NTP0_9ACTN
MRASGTVAAALALARDLPDGPRRLFELAAVAALADAARAPGLGLAARLDLLETALRLGEGPRTPALLRWCLTTVERRPGLLTGEDDERLRIAQEQAVAATLDTPRLDLADAATLVDDLSRWLRSRGRPPGRAYRLRARLADHVGDAAAARSWLARARAEGDDGCPACVAVTGAELLGGWGDWSGALRGLAPALVAGSPCTAAPERGLAAALLPYLGAGQPEAAARAHGRAWRRHRRERAASRTVATHLRFLALTGRYRQGFAALAARLPGPDEPGSELAVMELAAAGALLCRRAATDPLAEVSVPERLAEPDLAVLGGRLRDRAYGLAERFDARNGTRHQSDRMADWLAEALPGRRLGPPAAGPAGAD